MKRNILPLLVLLAMTGCAEPKAQPAKTVAPSSSHFEGIGRVSLHRGQPCAPQIMFDFDLGLGERVWLAVGAKQETLLLDAARRHQRVRLAGVWRRGAGRDCRYVSVTAVSP